MRTTTYKCDRCSAEDQDNKTLDLVEVGVHVGRYNLSSSYGEYPKVQYNQEWCIDCREKAGLSVPKAGKKVEVTPISLEDMVRDIAYEAACEALQNN